MNNQAKNSESKILFAAIMCHVFWGFSFMASKVALGIANMLVLLSHRFLVAFIVMTLIAVLGRVRIELKGKRIRYLLYLGLAEPIVYFLGEYYGIMHSNTIFSGVMIAMIPIASTLAAAPLLGEYPTIVQMLFGSVSVAGVIGVGLMSSDSGALDFGGVIGLIVAVLSAVAYTLLGRSMSKEFTPFERSFAMIGIGAVFFTLVTMIYLKGNIGEYLTPFGNMNYTISILFLAIFCSVGSYSLAAYSVTHLTVARHTVFSNLTTAVSVFAGAIFLHEPFTLKGLFFCVMILIGIYGVQRSAKK